MPPAPHREYDSAASAPDSERRRTFSLVPPILQATFCAMHLSQSTQAHLEPEPATSDFPCRLSHLWSRSLARASPWQPCRPQHFHSQASSPPIGRTRPVASLPLPETHPLFPCP